MFTFIIPSINRDTLAYAVNSALNQTYADFKIIICGDGVCVPPFDDPRSVSIVAPRRGNQSATRMYAISHATTEWCVFLDDDDWVVPEYLEKFIPLIEKSDIIISRMMNYGWEIPRDHELIHGSVGISFAVRTNFILQNPFPPPPSEDYVYLRTMRDNGARVKFTDYCGYFVRKYLTDGEYINAHQLHSDA